MQGRLLVGMNFAVPFSKRPIPSGNEELDGDEVDATEIPVIDYKIPEWSSLPGDEYYFEIIKQGSVLDVISIPMDKEYIICGNLLTLYI